MSETVPGATGFPCPLECGWHLDVPTEQAIREHLATHTVDEFVGVIYDLRVKVEQLRRAGSRPTSEATA
jgi:hypothetical protein